MRSDVLWIVASRQHPVSRTFGIVIGCVAVGVAIWNWFLFQRRDADDTKRRWYRHAAWFALAWAVIAFGRAFSGY